MCQFYVPGAHDNFECQGHELLFNNHGTMSLVLDCQSGLISSFVIVTTPLHLRVGYHISIPVVIHCI